MNLRRLLAPALVVPAVRSWGCPRLLARGTVVAYLDAAQLQSKPSPVDFPGEQLVAFADEHGNLRPGWLAKGTKVGRKKTSEAKLKTPLRQVPGTGQEEMRPIDKIRDLLWRKKMTVRRWWRGKIARKAVPRPILRKAIREFGGEPLKTDGTRELQEKLLRILGSTLPLTTQEGRMAAKKAAAKKSAAKKSARAPKKATRSRKQAADDEDDEDYEDEEDDDQDQDDDDEEEYDDEEDEDDNDDDEEDEDDEEEDDEPPRRSAKKASKKSAKKAASGSPRTSMLASVGNQVLEFGAAVRIAPEYKKLAQKMAADKPLSVKSYDRLVEHLRERRDATKKLKTSDANGLKKALRGVRMCQAKA